MRTGQCTSTHTHADGWLLYMVDVALVCLFACWFSFLFLVVSLQVPSPRRPPRPGIVLDVLRGHVDLRNPDDWTDSGRRRQRVRGEENRCVVIVAVVVVVVVVVASGTSSTIFRAAQLLPLLSLHLRACVLNETTTTTTTSLSLIHELD